MLRYSFFGLILAVDQLLLPMFHIRGMSIKPSHLVLGLWLLGQFVNENQDVSSKARKRDFLRLSLAFSGIVAAALLGDLILRASVQVVFSYQTIRNILFYALMVLSFGLGQSAQRFDMRWLTGILFVSLALNFLMTLFGNHFPWLVDLYYADSAYESETWRSWGVTSQEDFLARGRPLGLFGSPTLSMLQVNIVVLFVVIAHRHRLLPRPSLPAALAIMVLPISLTIVYGARSEFPVSLALAGVLAYTLWGKSWRSVTGRTLTTAVAVLLALSTLFVLPQVINEDSALNNNVTRMINLVSTADNPAAADSLAILRPLLTFETAYARFSFSPLFGSGFNEGHVFPFAESVQFFHNDWFFVLVTSGLVGFGLWLWIIRTFCMSIGWLALFPFFLPGMTNTFILSIPSVMFYFFMIGLLRERLRVKVLEAPIPQSSRKAIGAA